jgi:hypothetical protein
VRACRVVRARARHACDAFASPAADAPSRARRLSRADARSSGEGAARPPLCTDEAGESWSGQGHRGCTRRCLSRADVRTPVLGSLTRPAAGAWCWWRFQVQGPIGDACRQQSTMQLEVCHTELALQIKTAVYNAIRTRPGKRTPTMCFPGKGSTLGRQKSWQPGDRTTCVRCNRTIFIHVATLGA